MHWVVFRPQYGASSHDTYVVRHTVILVYRNIEEHTDYKENQHYWVKLFHLFFLQNVLLWDKFTDILFFLIFLLFQLNTFLFNRYLGNSRLLKFFSKFSQSFQYVWKTHALFFNNHKEICPIISYKTLALNIKMRKKIFSTFVKIRSLWQHAQSAYIKNKKFYSFTLRKFQNSNVHELKMRVT